MEIARMSLRRLRSAIQNNQVSFPSQVPMFHAESRADIQWRLVNLYFVSNWSCKQLGSRYGLTGRRTSQILAGWVQRATEHGYLQKIPPAAERMRRLRGRFADSEAAHAPMALGVAVSADAAAAAAAPHP
jgi:hypothetical protein